MRILLAALLLLLAGACMSARRVVTADGVRLWTMALVAEWATALPNARLLRLPDTAHFPHAERPEIVFPAIEESLR